MFQALPLKSNAYILIAGLASLLLSCFDVIATLILSLSAKLATTPISQSETDFNFIFLNSEILGRFLSQNSLPALILVGSCILLLKIGLSIKLQQWILNQFRKKHLDNAEASMKSISSNQLRMDREFDSQKIIMAVTDSLTAESIDVAASKINIFSEGGLLCLYLILLFIVDFKVTIVVLIAVAPILAFVLNKTNTASAKFGKENYEFTLESRRVVRETLILTEQLFLLGRQGYFKRLFLSNMSKTSLAATKQILVGQIPKYIVEILTVISFLFIGIMFVISDSPSNLVPKFAIFFLSASRIFPSLLRFQSALISFRASNSKASAYRDFKNGNSDFKSESGNALNLIEESAPLLIFENVRFAYPGRAEVFEIEHISMGPNGLYVLVGESGIGKTTLCRLALGFLKPDSGIIIFGGVEPTHWIRNNPGGVSYLSQEIPIIAGTLLENICLGVETEEIDYLKLEEVIDRSHLRSLTESLPLGLSTELFEGGTGFSGGQKQKIGLARAMYGESRLLILDEPTSALDTEAEFDILNTITNLSLDCLVLVISHSKNLIALADHVLSVRRDEGGITRIVK
jgi:ABC-type multidrug transport system fused ATPase/permease subunit